MRTLITALTGLLVCMASIASAEDGACLVAANLAHADFALPRIAAAIQKKQLNVTIIGSASSTIMGPAGLKSAYPIRLEAALARRFPDIAVKVSSHATPRQTAAEMSHGLERILVDEKPALVIWQTGTVDAMLGIDPEEFRSTLDEGVDIIQKAGANVIFMNMQYSPRTDTMIAAAPYNDAMRWVALQREIPLFDRLSIMRLWNDLGTFDFHSTTKSTDMAERVHNCIAQLLADLTVESARIAAPELKDVR
jgi:lysophospholipase L1-like esterase